jgi:hypothetical protein
MNEIEEVAYLPNLRQGESAAEAAAEERKKADFTKVSGDLEETAGAGIIELVCSPSFRAPPV